MAHIEIWESKPEWNQATTEERNRARHKLDDLVQRHAERKDGTCGPFMPCNPSGCTLIWEVPNDQADRLKKEYTRILSPYFERAMSGHIEGLTAKDYADRIANGG